MLRISENKWESMQLPHARDRHVVADISRFIIRWRYHGEERGYAERMRVLFPDDDGRWYAPTLGVDRQGSTNVVTVFGSSEKGFLENRLRGMRNTLEKNRK